MKKLLDWIASERDDIASQKADERSKRDSGQVSESEYRLMRAELRGYLNALDACEHVVRELFAGSGRPPAARERLARYLDAHPEDRGLSVRELARRAGVSKSTVQQYCGHVAEPDL